MTAVKSLTHIQQLASQRLPVPSAEVERLCERVKELHNTLEELRQAAAMLQQNSEGCAVNHYGVDFETHGMPGWLIDTAAVIEKARDVLAIRSLMDKGAD